MAPSNSALKRASDSLQLLNCIFDGNLDIQTTMDAKCFIKAICDQPIASNCIGKLVASKSGLDALQRALSIDISLRALRGYSTDCLQYLQRYALPLPSSTTVLQKLLESIASSPLYWNSLERAFEKGHLEGRSLQSFAWLLSELLSFSSYQTPFYRRTAGLLTTRRTLLDSPDTELKELGGKIRNILYQRKQPISGYTCGSEGEVEEDEEGNENDLQSKREVNGRQLAIDLAKTATDLQSDLETNPKNRSDLEQCRESITKLQRLLEDEQEASSPNRPTDLLQSEIIDSDGSNVSLISTTLQLSLGTRQERGARGDSVSSTSASAPANDWAYQRTYEDARNEHIDATLQMIGLEPVKSKFLEVKNKVDTAARQSLHLPKERFHAAFLGNPGTGKSTIARLYGKLLASIGALPGDYFYETTGAVLTREGVYSCKGHITTILENRGGVFFVDRADQLSSGVILAFLLAEIEDNMGRIVFLFAGHPNRMKNFFAHSPKTQGLIPHRFHFEDYTAKELLQVLKRQIEIRYTHRMRVERGLEGLYMRIVAERLSRQSGREDFLNIRAVQYCLDRIADRQASRLKRQRRCGQNPSGFLFTKEDLIGEAPAITLKGSKAWSELQAMIGLDAVKSSLQAALDRVQANYIRELEEKPPIECSLNKIFLGSPGTGKTTVAKLYARILAECGVLSTNEVVLKNSADFIGSGLGESEENTKNILALTVGKVLIIDEAYMLAGLESHSQSDTDSYRTAVVDTLVAEVQGTPGEDRCILLLGYRDKMEHMFQTVNPGLSRRFPMASAFEFEDFTNPQLAEILTLKLKQQGFQTTDKAKEVALEVLARARNRPNFGNAGEVDILLDHAKETHQRRMKSGLAKNADVFDPEDFDEDFDRDRHAVANCQKLFEGVIGYEDVVNKLQGYQKTALCARARGLIPQDLIPFNFLFKGPPGTGKTSTAQKMGKVFYDMGFLSSEKVVVCSTTDLIGQYIGQTGPKVLKMFEKALGRVLFIDEAYRLAVNEFHGTFAEEALDEIVDALTKPKFKGKLIVILAGYSDEMDHLLSVNPGLASRFSESIEFQSLDAESCLTLLGQDLKKLSVNVDALESLSLDVKTGLWGMLAELSQLKSWGNARDMKETAKKIFNKLLIEEDANADLVLNERDVLEAISALYKERTKQDRALTVAKDCDAVEATPQLREERTNQGCDAAMTKERDLLEAISALYRERTEEGWGWVLATIAEYVFDRLPGVKLLSRLIMGRAQKNSLTEPLLAKSQHTANKP